MKRLDGKVAIVTGGGSGIGRGIALKFALEGSSVIIVGRRENTLKEVSEENPNISYVVGDITDSSVISKVVDTAKEKFGHLDILVNNAGWCPVQPITKIILDDYDKVFDLDVRALVDMTIQALPMIIKSRGNIINLSSVGASHPGVNLSMYIGAKAAVENFTKAWALELASSGVRVNAIAPGAIRTNIWNVPGLSKEAKKHEDSIAKTIPFQRFGTAEEVANVALFLASDDASYVSGSIYGVDGGQGAQ